MERVMAWRSSKHLRADDVLTAICIYAQLNSGATPNARQVAGMLNVSHQRVSYLMMRLELARRITWITRYTYKVNDSVWDPPPDVDL
jgi:hypothetical protein